MTFTVEGEISCSLSQRLSEIFTYYQRIIPEILTKIKFLMQPDYIRFNSVDV